MSKEQAIATPSETRRILKQYDLQAKKSLGQNFLTDPNILAKLIAASGIDAETNVVEVGPGIGALTEYLAQFAKHVLACEIDQRFITVLADSLSDYNNVTVIHQDVLEADLTDLVAQHFSKDSPLAMVSNLPYYITTPVLMAFLHSPVAFDSLTVMVQKEVGKRLAAVPGTKAYGSLSIAVQYYMEAELSFIVPRTVFTPAPNVDSAVIHLKKREKPLIEVTDEPLFFALVRAGFAQRRKTLRNNLINAFGKEASTKEKLDQACQDVAIDTKRRGETLSIIEFGQLANALSAKGFTTADVKKY